jgi:PASTA domain
MRLGPGSGLTLGAGAAKVGSRFIQCLSGRETVAAIVQRGGAVVPKGALAFQSVKRGFPVLGVALVALALVTVPASAAALGWSRVFHGPNPAGQGQLLGVACPSASSCVAVGQSSEGTLAEVGGGATWRITTTPDPAGSGGSTLWAVACPSSADCVAVGAAYDQSAFNPSPNFLGGLIEQWNGSSWTIQPNPDAHEAGVFLNGVSCSSSSACIAVGSIDGYTPLPMALRWDGTSWTTMTVPAPAGLQSYLESVSCTSATTCIAVGGGGNSAGTLGGTLAEQWNGTAWRILSSPTSQSQGDLLNAVACASASACTAVGQTTSGTLVERWNGTAWSVQNTAVPGGESLLSGVSCPTATACTAVGYVVAGFPQTLAERWNGSTWSIQPMPKVPAITDIGAPAVACVSTSACTAVGGYARSGPHQTLIDQYGVLPCVVPDVKGQTLKAATRAIHDAHCSLGPITRRSSSTVKKGRVISQKPKPNLTEPGGSKIALAVSRGRKRR